MVHPEAVITYTDSYLYGLYVRYLRFRYLCPFGFADRAHRNVIAHGKQQHTRKLLTISHAHAAQAHSFCWLHIAAMSVQWAF